MTRLVTVSVEVAITISRDASPEIVKNRVVERLNQFLHPSEGYRGSGWPLGRDVYRSEVIEEILSVDGVTSVKRIDLLKKEGEKSIIGDINLSNNSRVISGEHKVDVFNE